MSKNRGFTTTELMIAIIFLSLVGAVFYASRSSLEASHRDIERKTDINALYYNLVEVAKPTLGGYPRLLNTEQIKSLDSSDLTDPQGKKLGTQGAEYRYDPTECNGGDICQSFTLRADLEREDTFVKRSPE